MDLLTGSAGSLPGKVTGHRLTPAEKLTTRITARTLIYGAMALVEHRPMRSAAVSHGADAVHVAQEPADAERVCERAASQFDGRRLCPTAEPSGDDVLGREETVREPERFEEERRHGLFVRQADDLGAAVDGGGADPGRGRVHRGAVRQGRQGSRGICWDPGEPHVGLCGREFMFTDHSWLAADPTLGPGTADPAVMWTAAWILPDERP
jgi:hypothetical protein